MKRILVIDDDVAVRELIVEALLSQSWEPLPATNGNEGLEIALRELPDLVLCDIQMPGKDGYEVLRVLRQNAPTAATPFIFLTGLSDKPRMRQAMELGADDYLCKPFTVKELVAAVESRLQRQELLAKSSDQKLHELRGNLTFALPHELVTPLNSILGFSSLILDSNVAVEIRDYAQLIRDAGERLKSLIEKFLLYAQLEVMVADPHQREAALGTQPTETADTVIAAAERIAHETNRPQDLLLRVSSGEHAISASHLARVVRELLENAFKFSEPGTRVEIVSGRENGMFMVEAVDQGRGFNIEQIRRVGAHQQFDRKLQEQQGSGLGLAICQRIAELHGGTLRINSSEGNGARVAITLPVRRR